MRTPTRRHFIALASAGAVAGCGGQGGFSVVDPDHASAGARADVGAGVQQLLVATTRTADPAPIAYGAGRAKTLDFARLAISIPPNHAVGQIERSRGSRADPARHFALTGAETLPDLEALVTAARAASTPGQEAVVFVHGYNNGFAKAAYRHAQVAWDYELKGPQIHFSWSSAANPFEYTYDRDSVLIARDALATLLRCLLREDGLRVSLVGHSMGGLLIMETLRQIALSGDRALLDRLSATTLISPDIDMDLFRAQAHALGHLPQPFTVAIAQNDRLLRLSSGLSGGAARLGSVEDLDQLEGLGVFVVDMTGIADTGSNHFLPGTSASAIALIKGLRDADALAPQSLSVGPVSIKLGG